MMFDLEGTIKRLDWLQERIQEAGRPDSEVLEAAYQKNLNEMIHWGYMLESDPYREWIEKYQETYRVKE